jgi:hypothetical protein
MTDFQMVEDIKDSLTFNLFVTTDDGRIAWTINPVSLDDLLTDGLSGLLSRLSLTAESMHSSFTGQFPNNGSVMEESVDSQTRPSDLNELFENDKASQNCFIPKSLPPHKQDYSTVRIYGRCLDLTPSSTKGTGSVRPSVITVERASLCQIFLETKYHQTFQQPNEREHRRQTLQSLVCKGKELTDEQRDKFNEIMKSMEAEWSRLSRVRPSLASFEVIRKLGSGGFGVVNLVQERQTGKLFAMKVPPLSSIKLR